MTLGNHNYMVKAVECPKCERVTSQESIWGAGEVRVAGGPPETRDGWNRECKECGHKFFTEAK